MTDQDAKEFRRLIRRYGHGKVIVELRRFLSTESSVRPQLKPVVTALQRAAYFSFQGFKLRAKL